MSIKFDQLAPSRRQVKVALTIGDGPERHAEEFTFTYNTITPERIDALRAMENEPGADQAQSATIARQLAYLEVQSEDILGDDDKPVQLTAERLFKWESTNLLMLQAAVLGQSFPKTLSEPSIGATS